jgi:hypothetical protein
MFLLFVGVDDKVEADYFVVLLFMGVSNELLEFNN